MSAPGLRPAVFLDRDGVLCANRENYVTSLDEFVPLAGAAEAVAALSRSGLLVVVVTNQSALGRGLLTPSTLEEIHGRLRALVEAEGGRIDEILHCPHTPEDACECRKPKPGLLLEAAARHGIDLASSVLVGDAETDVQAAAAAGCSSVLVLTGRGRAQAAAAAWDGARPDLIAGSLAGATHWILQRTAADGAASARAGR